MFSLGRSVDSSYWCSAGNEKWNDPCKPSNWWFPLRGPNSILHSLPVAPASFCPAMRLWLNPKWHRMETKTNTCCFILSHTHSISYSLPITPARKPPHQCSPTKSRRSRPSPPPPGPFRSKNPLFVGFLSAWPSQTSAERHKRRRWPTKRPGARWRWAVPGAAGPRSDPGGLIQGRPMSGGEVGVGLGGRGGSGLGGGGSVL